MQCDPVDRAGRKGGSPITEPNGTGENHRLMHEERPSEPERETLPAPAYRGYPSAPPPRRGGRTLGGFVAAALVLLAKFKGALLLLLNLKWLVFVPKLLLSFGTLFASIWFYALFFGWKFGIVFVLLILVHELGHFLTFRNFGISANLPFFIPGFGAFVATRGPVKSLTVEAIAMLAGPIFGIAAAGICYAYGISTHEPFWLAAAYVGFFLNALNLLPIPPFDGGNIAGAIDPRLWLVGIALFLAYLIVFGIHSSFTIVLVALVALGAAPRIIGLFQGRFDPRLAEVPTVSRVAIAAAYFVTIALAIAGAVASRVSVPGVTA
jgi:Zn-dependent protease